MEAIRALYQEIEGLEKVVETHLTRIAPVVRSAPEKEEGKEPEVSAATPLAGDIVTAAGRVRRISLTLHQTTQRVEL